MADTTAIKREGDAFIVEGYLLSAVTATTDGTWQPIFRKHPMAVTFEGSFSGTAKLLVSNASVKPSDSDNNFPQVGSSVSTTGVRTIDAPFKWAKVQVSAYTSGTLNANVASG